VDIDLAKTVNQKVFHDQLIINDIQVQESQLAIVDIKNQGLITDFIVHTFNHIQKEDDVFQLMRFQIVFFHMFICVVLQLKYPANHLFVLLKTTPELVRLVQLTLSTIQYVGSNWNTFAIDIF